SLADDGLDAGAQAELARYVDEVEALDGVTSVESVLEAPPGLPADQYAMLLALPADQRPPEVRAGLETYLADWIGGDTTLVQVRSRLLPDSDAGRELVDEVRAVASPSGAEVLTAGLPSRSRD